MTALHPKASGEMAVIHEIEAVDIRFPNSRELDGSDSMWAPNSHTNNQWTITAV